LFTKTAIPDASGNYWAFEPLYRTKYAPGNYIIKATYDDPSVSKGARTGNYIGVHLLTLSNLQFMTLFMKRESTLILIN